MPNNANTLSSPLARPLARRISAPGSRPFGKLPPAALAGITTIWIYDASIGFGIASGFETIMANYMAAEHGLTVTVVNKSVSGQTLAQIAQRYNDEKAAVAGRSDILIITMPIGNSISGRWYLRTDEFRNGLIAEYAAFIDSINANGNIAMPVNTTFRNYDQTTVNNEDAGSLPYNQHVIWPKAEAITPSMWHGDRPFLDAYNVARNWYSISLGVPDAIHYTPQGYHQLRSLYLDCAAARIKGMAPPRVPRVEDPTLNQVPPLSPAMVTFAAGGFLTKSSTVYWAMQRGQTFIGSGRLLALDGYDPNRMGIVTTTTAASSNTNSGAFNTGDKSKSLLNDGVKNAMIQSSSTTFFDVATFTGFAPGQSVKVDILSCRNAAGATNRVAQFTLDAGATMIDVNGAYPPGATPNIATMTGVANESGEITLAMRCKAGSGFVYLNGVIVTPL